MDPARARKLADRISQIVAEMLERRIKDPRLGFATVIGTNAERAETAIALASATGIIRSEVGRQLGLRHTPSLAFVADAVPETAQRIEELVTQARNADAELARRSEGAVPAGDPDPYRKPAEAGDEDGDDEDDLDGDG
jgi:ribosome-binding factor A